MPLNSKNKRKKKTQLTEHQLSSARWEGRLVRSNNERRRPPFRGKLGKVWLEGWDDQDRIERKHNR